MRWLRHDRSTPATSLGLELAQQFVTAGAHREALTVSALAEVAQELESLRRDSEARVRLEAALEPTIRPAIAEAAATEVGVLIAYSPDEVVARPSNAVPAGQALLLRSDKVLALRPSLPPIAFVGANQ